MRALPLILALGCAAPREDPVASPPASWKLVEVAAAGGRELVLEREEPATVVADARVRVRLSRERAPAGERVEAELWLAPGEGPQLIEIRPSRPGVSVLGPCEFWIEGSQRVRVLFTCPSPGRGGIVVRIKEGS